MKQVLALVLLASAGLLGALLPRCAAAADTPALAERIDHILLEQDRPEALFTRLTQDFQLPVVWPFASYGSFSSGGLSFGNVVVELGRLGGNPTQARWIGLALKPVQATAQTLAELDRRQIGHGPAQPYSIRRGDAPSWTNLRIDGIAPSDMRLFFCEYHMDAQTPVNAASAELARRRGGPLGLIGVRDLRVEVAELQAASRHWAALLPPAAGASVGQHALPQGPHVTLEAGPTGGIAWLVLEVASTTVAAQFLVKEGFVRDDKVLDLFRGSGDYKGLSLQLAAPR